MAQSRPEPELPRGVALAWGVAASPQRGPKRELSIERIVEAAVEIADAEGLAAVSMSSVASALGFTTMSLYRYVSAKDDLILLMQEHGIGLPPATIADASDWRTGLTLYAQATRESYAAHPWLVDVPILGTPNTPNNLAWMDAALGAMRETGLTHDERVGVLLLLGGHVRWEATINRGYTISNDHLGMTPPERTAEEAQLMASLVSEEAFPHLTESVRAGFMESKVNPFEFGLTLLLDGIGDYIARRAAGAPRAEPFASSPTGAHPKDAAVRAARQARREAETALREAQKREREAIKRAREREQRATVRNPGA